nr:reverse transcriptase domain-containing protein [Tanacetum cinerariifolium]
MMRVTTTFLKGEVAASNHLRKKTQPVWKQQEARRKLNFEKKGDFGSQKRSERRRDKFTLLTKSPREILALDKGKYKTPPPMTTPVEKNNNNKFCEFHREVVHNTDEYMHLRRQIEKLIKVGKLPRLEVKNQMVPAIAPLIGLSREIIWSMGQILLLVKIRDAEHSTLTWMNFVVVRSPSPYNGIIRRPESRMIITLEFIMVFKPEAQLSSITQAAEERIRVAIHPEYPEWRMSVDFKDLNKACPKDGYPLPDIDWKVESFFRYHFKYFLNAYKGYHQIKMAKEDDEKKAFISSQGIFCYLKMHFGLKNAGATYQRSIDKAFQKQISRNLEVFVDDPVIKSRTVQEIMRDVEETFRTLREINMKLNHKKCTFEVKEGMFLGYKVNTKGIKVCSKKVEAVLSLPYPKCLKGVQKLNGKLASLNRLLSKSVEKSLLFFKALKKCMKKSDFQWTAEAEAAFKQMKKLIVELPTLIAPMEKEELTVYLAAK